MARWTERTYLLTDQYRDASKLQARMGLHDRYGVNPYNWHRWVFDQLDLPPGGSVLELGCGPAMLWRENGERIPAGWTVVLADLSVGMLQEARRHLRALPRRFGLVNLDAQSLPLASARFDAVIANHMLYHVPDVQRALRELRRVARATVYASTVGADHMRELHELVQGWGVAPLEFRLDNAEPELRRVFHEVELRTYEDSIEVPEAEPLLAVVRSGVANDLLDADELARIRREIEERIAREGSFHVTKSTGVFVCR